MTNTIELPSLIEVSRALDAVSRSVDGECDVRLQVYPDGQWAIRWGLSDYDQDHRGYWGASIVDSETSNLLIAQDLLDQVAEDIAMSTEGGI